MYDEAIKSAVEGLRANEVRYFKTHYDYDFVTKPASEAPEIVRYVSTILESERGIVIGARPMEVSQLFVDNIKWTHVFYENGLAVNVLYQLAAPNKRAVGFKLSQGMDVPVELNDFKFARQRSKLAGEIRGSYFVIKNEYDPS